MIYNYHDKQQKNIKKIIFCNRQINIRKASDIAAICNTSAIKSSTDELVYIWGTLAQLSVRKPVISEHTNIFDICNSMTGQSPISMVRIYTDEEYSILNDLEAAFDDHVSLIF